MIPQLVDNLVVKSARSAVSVRQAYLIHLKRCRNGFNQDSPSDRSTRHANVILGNIKDIIPQTSFEVRFHLGQIKVRSSPSFDEFFGIVEEVETEIEQTS